MPYIGCGIDVIESFDGARRRSEVEIYRSHESDLARKAGLAPAARMSFPTHTQEIKRAQTLLEDAHGRFVSFAKVIGEAAPKVAMPVATPPVPAKPLSAISADQRLVEDTRQVLKDSKSETTAIVPRPLPEAVAERADEPATKSAYYVARLLPDGASMDIGQQTKGCIDNMQCETGSIIALIAATGYCKAEGEVTKTVSGWGMLVQRYQPETRAQEKKILAGDGASRVHVIAGSDKAAMKEGLKEVRALTMEGDQVFFTSYQPFTS